MAKTLAELRADSRSRLPEWTHTLCLAQDLVAKVQALRVEQDNLVVEVARLKVDLGLGATDDETGEQPKKPRRSADPRMARLKEAEARVEAIPDELAGVYDEMREHEGDLLMRAIPAGEWRRWVDANPARVEERDKENRPILNPLDEQYTGGFCNAQALADTMLRKFAVSWNGETISDADWTFLMDNAASGDIKAICQAVIAQMELPGAQAPKASSTASSGTRSTARA